MSLRDKMLAVMADVNASVAEREELVELIAIALLTRKNLFILGDPGQAKSYAINAFRSRITGAKQFERLLSKQTDEEQLFGRLDLSSLIPGSVPESAFEGDGIYQNLRFDLQSFLNGLPQMKMRQRHSRSWQKSAASWMPIAKPSPRCILVNRSYRPRAKFRRPTLCFWMRSSNAMTAF